MLMSWKIYKFEIKKLKSIFAPAEFNMEFQKTDQVNPFTEILDDEEKKHGSKRAKS